jgi:tRNA-binding protein
MTATIEDFEKLELRVGRIVRAEKFPEARKPAYKLTIDFGPLGMKRSSAQITSYYTPESLIGMTVIAVTNFAPRRVAGFESEVLVLGVEDAEHRVTLLTTERDAELGARIS